MKQADLLIRNGLCITMDERLPEATAVAICGDRIAWVGEQSQSEQWIGPNTHILDMQGAYVYPGFIDSHIHLVDLGAAQQYINLSNARTKESVVQLVQAKVSQCKPGEWILGMGWDQDRWPERTLPTASDLDCISPHNPVLLSRVDTHSAWANTLALQQAGIHAHAPDPKGGKIYRNTSGEPTGFLLDQAMQLVLDCIPSSKQEAVVELTQQAIQECLKQGITMIHNAVTSPGDWEAFKILDAQQKVDVRIYAMALLPGPIGETLLEKGPQCLSPFLEMRCVKFFMDGAMGSRGAALLEDYQDDPGNRGLLLWKEDDLVPILKKARSMGLQAAFHAIGDHANHLVLNAYERADCKGLRWRIEHAQLLAPKDIERFASLDIVAAMQPLHLSTDIAWFENRVGKDRACSGAFPWRSLLDRGVRIAGGSDAPVVDVNPLWGMYAAITRQDINGNPKEGWFSEQCVTPLEALRMYTLDAAYSAYREHELGSITPGKLADLVILPENILLCNPKALIDMKILYTIVNGKIKFIL